MITKDNIKIILKLIFLTSYNLYLNIYLKHEIKLIKEEKITSK